MEAARRLLDRYQNNPALFAWEVFGTQCWEAQQDICLSVARYSRVTVKSGHKIGKSRTAAVLAYWWVCTRPRARVIMTSASARQIRTILWREIKTLHRDAAKRNINIGGKLNESPENGLQFPDQREIVGFSTREPERMAGISGQNVLFIVDEASGVPEEIFQAIEGNRAGGARLAMFSNPTKTSGEFFASFNDPKKSKLYHKISVSSADTPNVKERRVVIEGLATYDWLIEKQEEWSDPSDPGGVGKTYLKSPLYQVRVQGNFPTQSDSAVIPLYLVSRARAEYDPQSAAKSKFPLVVGVDVARYGDDETVIIGRRGPFIVGIVAIHKMDGCEVAQKVTEFVHQHRYEGERATRVNVDVIGPGASVVDQLKGRPQIRVCGINCAMSAEAEGYDLLRDQLWFGVRQWLEAGGTLPPDDRLEKELIAPIYLFNARGQYKVSAKDVMKAELGRSPDRADALGLACYEGNRVEFYRSDLGKRPGSGYRYADT
ncbi:MAG: terminase large subunit domain-containing protein [Kofleriaceae bacterium]